MLRKRNRPSIVCTFCKKRKVRCDKGNPCSTCVKYGNKDCVYGDSGPLPDAADAVSELEFLKHKVQMLESSFGLASLSRTDTNHRSSSSLNVTPDSVPSVPSQPCGASPPNGAPNMREQASRGFNNGNVNGYMVGSVPSTLMSPSRAPNLFGSSFSGPFSTQYNSLPALHGIPRLENRFSRDHNSAELADVQLVLGKNPIGSYSDTINFYHGYSLVFLRGETRKSFGPLSWVAHVQTNQPLKHMWLFMKLINVHQRKMKLLMVEENVQYDNKEREFRERLEEAEGLRDEKPFKKYPNATISATVTNAKKSNPAFVSRGVLFCDGETSSVDAIVEAVREILPSKKLFWSFISRFFQNVYPFFPLVDELTIRENCTRIFASKSEDSEVIDDIRVERRLDLAHIGLVLIILRLSYLSLFSNVAKVSGLPHQILPEAQILLESPVEGEIVNIAHHCLNQFNICGSISIPVLQLALFVRLYQIYGPEVGDQGSDLGNRNLLTTAIIQMAQSMGLNREPDPSMGPIDDRKNMLRRKIWYYLLVLDMNSALFLGGPMSVSKNMFDTRAPFYIPGVRNVENEALEEMTDSTYDGFDYMWEQLYDLIGLIMSIKGTLYLHEFTAKLSILEQNTTFNYQKLMEILDDDTNTLDVFSKVMKLKIYFSCTYFLSTIHLRLSSYFENKGDIRLSFYYMKKACLLTVHDMLSLHHSITLSNTAIFRRSTDIVITPGFISLVNSGVTIILSLRIRTLASIIIINEQLNQGAEDEDKSTNLIRLHQKLTKLKHLLEDCFKKFINLIAHLSTKYIYAWKMLKIFGFMDDILKDQEFHDRLRNRTADSLPATYDLEMVSSLISLLESTLAKIKKKPEKDDLKNKFSQVNRDSPTGSVSSDSIPDSEQIDQMWLQLMSQKNVWLQGMEPLRERSNGPNVRPSEEEIGSFNEYNDLVNYESLGFDGLISSQAGKSEKDKVVNFNIFDSLPMGEMYGSFN